MERHKRELLEIPKLNKSIAHFLSEIIKGNADIEYNPNDPFSCKDIPSVTILFYLDRLKKYCKAETSTVIITLIYVDLLCESNRLMIYPNNVHRILLSCYLLAIKYNEDSYYDNEYYSKVGGIPLKELNMLEYYVTEYLEFNFFVNDTLFNKYAALLKDYPSNMS